MLELLRRSVFNSNHELWDIIDDEVDSLDSCDAYIARLLDLAAKLSDLFPAEFFPALVCPINYLCQTDLVNVAVFI